MPEMPSIPLPLPIPKCSAMVSPGKGKRGPSGAHEGRSPKRPRAAAAAAAAKPLSPLKTPLVRVRGQQAKSLALALAQRLAETSPAAGTPPSASLHKPKPKPEQNAAPPEHVVAWIVRCAEAVKRDGYAEDAAAILASVDTYEELIECQTGHSRAS